MAFNFLEYFYTDKYDNKTVIKKNGKDFSLSEIKRAVSYYVYFLKKSDEKEILIDTEDNFDFILLFISCILANKNIIVSNSNKKENKNAFLFSKEEKIETRKIFDKVDIKKINLTISTSGSTNEAKIITKTINQVLKESHDFISELEIPVNKNLEFIISAPINHMYAITAYIFVPLDSQNIINTERINYPNDLKIKNSVFVSTPSFLSYMQKFDLYPNIKPYMIFSAGAKLKKETHKYFEKYSKVINLYGCTETGFIAYKKESGEDFFNLFSGIKICKEEKIKIISEYSMPKEFIPDDEIILDKRKIKILDRVGRVFKIQEKRVFANEIEDEILKNRFVYEAAIINHEDKIAALVALNDNGKSFLIKKGAYSLAKEIKQELIKKFNIVPQKWKFIDEIQKNKMGKVDYKKIKELFSINLSLPLILKKEIKENCAEFELCFYGSCNFFKGHFDNYPITAGVVQLYYAMYFIKEAFKKDCTTGQIKRLKFSNIIYPDKIIKLKLEKREKSINFEYYDDKKNYSSGAMPVYNIFQEDTK